MNKSTSQNLRVAALVAGLVMVTLGIFWPATRFEFITYDDTVYVTENPMVLNGLTGEGLAWAFQTGDGGNWNPLTWLSHMLDVQLFGLDSGAHHRTNVLLHSINSGLLLLLLWRLTGALGLSVVVAGLFALHPLRVESVAWVAERKDVLSVFFGLLALLAYARFAQAAKAPGSMPKVTYVAALVLFALSLMSKPTLVTLPFVLLLLDFWPLQRITWPLDKPMFRRLVVEKWPFFLMTIALCVVTYLTQSQVGAITEVSFLARIERVFIAYGSYLAKLFVPLNLAMFYPVPKVLPIWLAAGALVMVILVSLIVVRNLRRAPALAMGWFWFLGTLIPMIGIVQIGQQLLADRYTYFPSVGFFIAVVWGVAALLDRWQLPSAAQTTAGIAVLALAAMLTSRQLPVWHDSETLYAHALAVTKDNHVANNNLAVVLLDKGNAEQAIQYASEALRIDPTYAAAHMNLGNAFARSGRTNEALAQIQRSLEFEAAPNAQYNLANLLRDTGDLVQAELMYRTALAQRPGLIPARYNLGLLLHRLNRSDEALVELTRVLGEQPDYPGGRSTLGGMLASQGKHAEAIEILRQQLIGHPNDVDARFNLGQVYCQAGQAAEAREQFEAALLLQPDDLAIRSRLGTLLLQTGRHDEAVATFSEIARRAPGPQNFYQLALAQMIQGDFTNGIASLRQTLALWPDSAVALNELAWALATVADDSLRKPEEAIILAARACELTTNRVARCLGTLDAAYAAAGQFNKAIETAAQVVQMGEASRDTEIVTLANERLALYRAGKPYRQSSVLK